VRDLLAPALAFFRRVDATRYLAEAEELLLHHVTMSADGEFLAAVGASRLPRAVADSAR
jgi:hypothetical protein